MELCTTNSAHFSGSHKHTLYPWWRLCTLSIWTDYMHWCCIWLLCLEHWLCYWGSLLTCPFWTPKHHIMQWVLFILELLEWTELHCMYACLFYDIASWFIVCRWWNYGRVLERFLSELRNCKMLQTRHTVTRLGRQDLLVTVYSGKVVVFYITSMRLSYHWDFLTLSSCSHSLCVWHTLFQWFGRGPYIAAMPSFSTKMTAVVFWIFLISECQDVIICNLWAVDKFLRLKQKMFKQSLPTVLSTVA